MITGVKIICPFCFAAYDSEEAFCWLCYLGFTKTRDLGINEEGHNCGSWPDHTWTKNDFAKKAALQESCNVCKGL